MADLRSEEQRAERLAHILDDVLRLPGTGMRFGFDPLLGLFPVLGDVMVTAWGAMVLVNARRLHLPWSIVSAMAYNLIKNGVIGAIPLAGDAYSFWFKSHARNAAMLLRAVKRGEQGACRIPAQPLRLWDVALLAFFTIPPVAATFAVSLWFWNADISLFTMLFPPPYQSRLD